MTDRLAQMQARADAATEGPWFQHQDWIDMGVPDASHTISDDPKPYGKFIASVGLHYDVKHANADFIAHARTDVPALLAMVRERDAALDALMAEIVTREERWKKAWEGGEMSNDEASSAALEDRWAYAQLADIRAAITATEGA